MKGEVGRVNFPARAGERNEQIMFTLHPLWLHSSPFIFTIPGLTTRVIDTAQCLKYGLNQLKWLKTGVIAGSGFTSARRLGLDRSVDAVIARRYSLSSTDYAMDRGPDLKTTGYFEHMRKRPDRAMILDEWITHVIQFP